MKKAICLRDVPQGESFFYAEYPSGGEYVKGGRVPNGNDTFYVHSPCFIYIGRGDSMVVKI